MSLVARIFPGAVRSHDAASPERLRAIARLRARAAAAQITSSASVIPPSRRPDFLGASA